MGKTRGQNSCNPSETNLDLPADVCVVILQGAGHACDDLLCMLTQSELVIDIACMNDGVFCELNVPAYSAARFVDHHDKHAMEMP